MKFTFNTSLRQRSEIGFVPGRNKDFWEPEHAQNRERIILRLDQSWSTDIQYRQ